jgi:5'-3' exonuclease
VILKIEEYIKLVNPSETIYIAFDGVAPVAKLNQQRCRRYKSHYQNQMKKSIYKNSQADAWNTASITPGTKFMNKLNENINYQILEVYQSFRWKFFLKILVKKVLY